jgi:rubrerythrin
MEAGGIAVNDIRAKVAYLHGLAEGLDLDTTSNEGRVLTTMLDVVADMAEQLIDVSEAQGELAEYVEDLDFDLGALEESVYGEVEDEDGDVEFQAAGDDDEEGEEILFISEDALTEDEDGVAVLRCPTCGETLSAGAGGDEVDEEAEIDVLCPVCGCSLQEVETDYDTPVVDH